MGRWRGFLDSLDSDGGHILALVIIMGMGALLSHYGSMHGEVILDGSFGALLLKLKDAGSNREQFGANTSTTTTSSTQEKQ